MSTAQVLEIKHRNVLGTTLLNAGWLYAIPILDNGIDLIAYREDTGETRLVQQKGRADVNRKYQGRNMWMAFPVHKTWVWIEHDQLMLEIAENSRTGEPWARGAEGRSIYPPPSWMDETWVNKHAIR